jgi:tetratricopeptide (TPR) repeat protein
MERALALGFAADPTRVDLRDDLVVSYVVRGVLTQAAATLERALEASSDASLRWRLSELYQGAGNLDAALRAIDFVPASRSEKAELGHRRFLVLDAAGRTEDALLELEAAYHIDNRYGTELLEAIQRTALAASSERWSLAAADLFARHGEPARARQTVEGWLEANPTSRPALRHLAKLAAKERDFSTAIDAYKKLSRTETGEARKSAALELAKVCAAAGRAEDALADLETALADAPTDAELCDSVRKLYGLAGARRKQARMVVDQAARTTPSTARAALLLEATELFIGERAWGEALDAAEQARTLDPASAKAALLASRIFVSRGEGAKAIETLAKFASAQKGRKSKDLAQVFGALADLYLANDELIDALEALSQAHRLDKSDTEIAYLLGLVALDLDQVDMASAALRAFVATRKHVVKSTPTDEPTRVSRAYFHLAVIEHARGDEGAARRMVSRAMEESPNNGDARRLMDELRPSSLGN